jgi:hypothetical protein
MRRRTLHITAVLLGAAAVAAASALASSTHRTADRPMADMPGMTMSSAHVTASTALPALQLSQARLATARFATGLGAAKAAGYQILTTAMPGMGYHYIDPRVKGFDVRRPPILVYEKHGATWQLGAVEWVFPAKPAKAPLAGARYGSFPAACHYLDGSWMPEPSAAACPAASPKTGVKLNFWHPKLVTLHVWLWYPNPDGIYSSTNPLVGAFS